MDQLNHSSDTQTLLRKHGMKATPQRLAIADLLLTTPKHVTAQQVYEQLRLSFPSISQNTVYLTLASFEESGLLRRFHANGRTIFDSNTHSHDHACCNECGTITDIPVEKKTIQPDELGNWEIHNETRTWTGFCPDCTTSPAA